MEEDNIKNSFSKLSEEHKKYTELAFAVSDSIYFELERYYTDDKIRTFKSFEDFLDDINYMIETSSFAKQKFIKHVHVNYFGIYRI